MTEHDRDAMAAAAVASIKAMADGDLGMFRDLIHPEAVNLEATGEPPAARVGGPEGFYATALWLRTAFSDLCFDVTTTVIEGDLVVTHGTMAGRHTGEFVAWNPAGQVERAFAPTGKPFSVNHSHFLKLRSHLVIEHWAVRDDNSLAIQLGWVPPSPLFLMRCGRATRRARKDALATGSATPHVRPASAPLTTTR
jgi:predicted ester cyclase